MDQLANHAAKLRYMSGGRTSVPMTVRTVASGGRQFGAQHSQSLEAWLMHVPGLKVVVPGTPADAKGLLTSCIADDDPCVFMESSMLLSVPGRCRRVVPPFRWVRPTSAGGHRRHGRSRWGWQVRRSLAAAENWRRRRSVEVLDLRTLVPLDRSDPGQRGQDRPGLVVHAATQFAGPGAELAAMIQQSCGASCGAPSNGSGAPTAPIPFAAELEPASIPDQRTIAAAIRKMA